MAIATESISGQLIKLVPYVAQTFTNIAFRNAAPLQHIPRSDYIEVKIGTTSKGTKSIYDLKNDSWIIDDIPNTNSGTSSQYPTFRLTLSIGQNNGPASSGGGYNYNLASYEAFFYTALVYVSGQWRSGYNVENPNVQIIFYKYEIIV